MLKNRMHSKITLIKSRAKKRKIVHDKIMHENHAGMINRKLVRKEGMVQTIKYTATRSENISIMYKSDITDTTSAINSIKIYSMNELRQKYSSFS